MSVAIRAENLSKSYLIRHQQREPYVTLRDVLANGARTAWRRFRYPLGGDPGDPGQEEFWALRDINFEIEQGDRVGIIGRNGAGKSTLLKLLSRITEPTTGRFSLNGRVASLLEVGTGFHPELTGRENIFLNGAVLGMSRAEIKRKFDEIVDFAEVERFLDTPVKRYSSGMYVRLAFAVAAHLEPEILIVDEVLAVGDASFQKKCLSKMGKVAAEGRTVLFVSHNMQAITRLCRRAILLHEGTVLADAPTHEVVNAYMSSGIGTTAVREWTDPSKAPGDHVARIRAVRVRTEDAEIREAVDIRRPIGIEMEFEVLEAGYLLVPNYGFYNDEGVLLFIAHDSDPEWRARPRPRGRYRSTAWVPGNFFAEGNVIVGVAVSTHDPVVVHAAENDVVAFHVVDSLDGDAARGDYAGPMPGLVRPLLRWETEVMTIEKGLVLSAAGEGGR